MRSFSDGRRPEPSLTEGWQRPEPSLTLVLYPVGMAKNATGYSRSTERKEEQHGCQQTGLSEENIGLHSNWSCGFPGARPVDLGCRRIFEHKSPIRNARRRHGVSDTWTDRRKSLPDRTRRIPHR